MGNYTGFPIYGRGSYSAEGIPYTPATKESVKKDYNAEEVAACEAWGVDMLTDIFPQASEFKLLPYSALWAYQKPQELANMENILNEIAWPSLVKIVTGSEADFESNWQAMVDELYANGLEDANKAMTDFLAGKIIEK